MRLSDTAFNLYRLPGHGDGRRNASGVPRCRERGQHGKRQCYSDTNEKHDRLHLRRAADGGIQLLRAVRHENIRIQCAGGGNQHALGRQNAQQQSDRDTNTAQEQQLHRYQPVDLSALCADGAECAVLLHPLGDGDLQDIVDNKSGRQQDKYADDDAGRRHKGKTGTGIAVRIRIIGDAQSVQQHRIVLDERRIHLQGLCQIKDNALEVLSALCLEVCGNQSVFLRQQRFGTALANNALNSSGGIAEIAALQNTGQRKIGGIFYFWQQSVHGGDGQSQADGIVHGGIFIQILQGVLRQGHFTCRLWQTTFFDLSDRRVHGKRIAVVLPQREFQTAAAKPRAAEIEHIAYIRKPRIVVQRLCLLLRQLVKGGITAAVQALRLLHSHGLQNADGLTDDGGHQAGQNHGN